MSYYNTLNSSLYTEQFSNNSIKNYVLMGDSILNNFSYVPDGKSVASLLKKQTPDGHVVNLAKNDAIMPQIPPQIDKLRELDSFLPTLQVGFSSYGRRSSRSRRSR